MFSGIVNKVLFDSKMGLTATTTLAQSGPGSNGNKGVLHIPKDPELEPQHQIVWYHAQDTC